MALTQSSYLFRINGVISTDKTVYQNIETLASAAGAWFTYDYHAGKWSVNINKAGSSIASFNDSNIIGGINVSGTGIKDLYNSVRVEFPHLDLNDETDYINIEIPTADRFAGEVDNQLQIHYDILNDPIQAQHLGLIELKQSRVDTVIEFVTDFSKLGLNSGDLIDVTNTVLGWTSKVFRIITISEEDADDGNINIKITALEYDANVYDTTDLYRYIRTNENGIISIGSIDAPGVPEVTKFQDDARPRIVIESTVNGGLVEGLEYWYYSIPESELSHWQTVDDETRTYTLYQTVRPGGGRTTFDDSEVVSLDMDNLDPGNFLVKTRSVNTTTSSEFSEISGLVEYIPTQITNQINNDTTAADNSGNILNTLGLAGLMKLLDNLIAQNNPAASGGIYDKFNTTYNTATGKELTQAQTSVSFTTNISETTTMACLTAMEYTTNDYHVYGSATANRSNWIKTYSVIPSGWDLFEVEIKTPNITADYDVIDNNGTEIVQTVNAQPAFFARIWKGSDLSTATKLAETTVDWNSNYVKLNISTPAADTYWVTLNLIPTYDLNLYWDRSATTSAYPNEIYLYNFQTNGPDSSTTSFKMSTIAY